MNLNWREQPASGRETRRLEFRTIHNYPVTTEFWRFELGDKVLFRKLFWQHDTNQCGACALLNLLSTSDRWSFSPIPNDQDTSIIVNMLREMSGIDPNAWFSNNQLLVLAQKNFGLQSECFEMGFGIGLSGFPKESIKFNRDRASEIDPKQYIGFLVLKNHHWTCITNRNGNYFQIDSLAQSVTSIPEITVNTLLLNSTAYVAIKNNKLEWRDP